MCARWHRRVPSADAPGIGVAKGVVLVRVDTERAALRAVQSEPRVFLGRIVEFPSKVLLFHSRIDERLLEYVRSEHRVLGGKAQLRQLLRQIASHVLMS